MCVCVWLCVFLCVCVCVCECVCVYVQSLNSEKQQSGYDTVHKCMSILIKRYMYSTRGMYHPLPSFIKPTTSVEKSAGAFSANMCG